MKIAIIGASKDRSKSGNKAVRAYRDMDHVVFPINPNEREIEGLKCYSSLREVPLELDAVSLYLPPEIGLKVVEDIYEKQVEIVYLNPGSASKELIKKLKSININPIQTCSIRAIHQNPDDY